MVVHPVPATRDVVWTKSKYACYCKVTQLNLFLSGCGPIDFCIWLNSTFMALRGKGTQDMFLCLSLTGTELFWCVPSRERGGKEPLCLFFQKAVWLRWYWKGGKGTHCPFLTSGLALLTVKSTGLGGVCFSTWHLDSKSVCLMHESQEKPTPSSLPSFPVASLNSSLFSIALLPSSCLSQFKMKLRVKGERQRWCGTTLSVPFSVFFPGLPVWVVSDITTPHTDTHRVSEKKLLHHHHWLPGCCSEYKHHLSWPSFRLYFTH